MVLEILDHLWICDGRSPATPWLAQLLGDGPGLELAWQGLLARAEKLGHVGSWAWNVDSEEIVWSGNLFRIHGMQPDEVTPTFEIVRRLVHPDDLQRWADVVFRAREESAPPRVTYRIVLAGGEVRHLESDVAFLGETPDGSPCFVGCVRNVSHRCWAEREIAVHVAVQEALSGWESLGQGAPLLLRGIATAMQFVRGGFWVPRGEFLSPLAVWSPDDPADVLARARQIRVTRGDYLVGRAWASREPVAISDVNGGPWRQNSGLISAESLRGGVAIPALHGGEVLAVLGFVSREELALTERLFRSLVGIGHEIGYFLAQHRGQLNRCALTGRQIEVLQLAAAGLTVRDIADRLSLTRATVKTHLENIYARYGVTDRTAAVATGLREGLIE